MNEITNALYAEIDRLRAENKRLEEELESHAWEISPAMAQAKIDHLNKRVAELEAALKRETNEYIEASHTLIIERDEAREQVKKLEAERDADRRREYGYSQQTVDALTAERDALKWMIEMAEYRRQEILKQDEEIAKLKKRFMDLGADMRERGVAT